MPVSCCLLAPAAPAGGGAARAPIRPPGTAARARPGSPSGPACPSPPRSRRRSTVAAKSAAPMLTRSPGLRGPPGDQADRAERPPRWSARLPNAGSITEQRERPCRREPVKPAPPGVAEQPPAPAAGRSRPSSRRNSGGRAGRTIGCATSPPSEAKARADCRRQQRDPADPLQRAAPVTRRPGRATAVR